MASIRDDLRIVERQTANATRIAIKLMELLQMLINMKSFTDRDSLEVMQLLKKHVDKGGELMGDQIQTENKELFVGILKEKGVPALAIDSMDSDGNGITFITYRDSDKYSMREVRDQFKHELEKGLSEMLSKDRSMDEATEQKAVREGVDMEER